MDFMGNIKKQSELCNRALDAYFEDLKECVVFDAMAYSIKSGGKRLRMIMLLQAARLFCADVEKAMPFACAIEMIHTYSLIHDDLPAMDDSDFRRGNPSNHKVFGEDMAILAGDGLLHYAFEVMTAHALKDKENCYRYLGAMHEIAAGAGVGGMLYGQAIDVSSGGIAKDISQVELIHSRKTAAMFVGAMRAGAIIGGASGDELALISDYALSMGVAFQITDDILDEIGDEKILGKTTGADKANNKITYLTFMSVDEAREKSEELLARAKSAIKPLDKEGFFTDLCDYLAGRES